MATIPRAVAPPEFNSGRGVLYKKVQYTVASFDPVTDKYTIFSVEKVGKNKFGGKIKLDHDRPKSNYGKTLQYKEMPWTIKSFDSVTNEYTITSVQRVGKRELEEENKEK
ncbi:hypothetical protein ACSS6W_004764 [Trichoderma asperelloides]